MKYKFTLIHKVVLNEWKHPKRNNNRLFNKKNFKKYISNEILIDNSFFVLTIEKPNYNNHHIIFLHGGAYIMDALFFHRDIFKIFANKGYRCSFIDYPKAPIYDASKTIEVVYKSYLELLKKYPNDNFHFFGDSAGGGLELAILYKIRDNNLLLPNSNALISPWLDVSMQTSKADNYDFFDILLPENGLKQAGIEYAKDLDITDPSVSPIYGDVDNLNNFILFYADNELLKDDSIAFINKVKQAKNTHVEFHVAKKSFHDYVIVTALKIAKYAIELIDEFFRKNE